MIMRFFEYSINTTRLKKRFAILPIKVKHETRWLETVYLVERYEHDYGAFFTENSWKPKLFITDKEYDSYKEYINTEPFFDCNEGIFDSPEKFFAYIIKKFEKII